MRDNVNSRDGELQRLMHKQGARFTTMLAIAIFLSIAALVAVCVMGYLVIMKGK
jgi:fatty acid desaturase